MAALAAIAKGALLAEGWPSWRASPLPVALSMLLLAGCGGGGGSATPAQTNQPPVAAAKVAGEAVLQATTRFDTAGTADPDGNIASRSWNYGDGQTGSTDSHIYASAGSYTATLTVQDNAGASASVQVPVNVAKCSADGLALAAGSPQRATVCMQTNQGELVLELFPAQAPVTVANFLAYVDAGFYNGTLFHRAEPGFVIQGGGYTSGMVVKTATQAAIALESANGLPNNRYTVAMARTSVPDSATSQFFVNLADNAALNFNAALGQLNGYAVFGQLLLTSGTDAVLAAIETAPATNVGGLRVINAANEVEIRSAIRVP
ncbi:peptidylprolyl isomerase [Aquabacterium sp. OR-4]|uniref:peptidylprolyl isomerase n=1 Tax=Aquabacterium sp. OR-4 TaxID=2978127 RepID=UPI0028C532F0|nr:peptidylprolyl isomerase [Aquabacterium sp. OR-4]MDT7837876.1 peptidylprolyl isomerase [Aquabacterium sp. OR-4]